MQAPERAAGHSCDEFICAEGVFEGRHDEPVSLARLVRELPVGAELGGEVFFNRGPTGCVDHGYLLLIARRDFVAGVDAGAVAGGLVY